MADYVPVDLITVSLEEETFHIPYAIMDATIDQAKIEGSRNCGGLLLDITAGAEPELEIAISHDLIKNISDLDPQEEDLLVEFYGGSRSCEGFLHMR